MNCAMCGAPATRLAHFVWLCPRCGNTADSSIQEGDVLMGKATVGTFLFDPVLPIRIVERLLQFYRHDGQCRSL